MFNCYVHGWSHYERMCPACPSRTQTSSSCSIPLNATLKEVTYKNIGREQELESKLALAVEALERIDKECSRDDTTAWSIANDALEKLK